MTLLIVSNSVDGTSDILSKLLAERSYPLFRWNIDLWRDYEIEFDGDEFSISDPSGRTLKANQAILLWRKPFTELMNFDDLKISASDEDQARAQVGQWLSSLVASMMAEGRVRLVEPYADRRLPKLYQLKVASRVFKVPPSHFSISKDQVDIGPTVVVKPLGNPAVELGKIFYSTRVEKSSLYRPYPWFMQQALFGGKDITCVYIDGDVAFYECLFSRSQDSIDWRVEINTEHQSKWTLLEHERLEAWSKLVREYMHALKLTYGRLDFILLDDHLYFLECNTNGEFGWLDDPVSLNLHRKFLGAVLK